MKKKKKDKNKLIVAFIGVLLTISIIVGSTLAYFRWETADNQKTTINVTVKGGSLTITGDNVTSTYMRPTNDCDGAAALVGETTVTAENETAFDMTATLKLNGTLISSHGTLNTNECSNQGNKDCLKWAIVETTSAEAANNACDSTSYKGTLKDVASNTNFDTGISFAVGANKTVTKKYKVYVWLDDEYTHTNTGTTVSDPMQDLKLTVKWSTASTLIQDL